MARVRRVDVSRREGRERGGEAAHEDRRRVDPLLDGAVGHAHGETDLRRHRAERDVAHDRRGPALVLCVCDIERRGEQFGLTCVQGRELTADADEVVEERFDPRDVVAGVVSLVPCHASILVAASDIAS